MSKSSTTAGAVVTPNRVTTHPGEVLNEEFLKPLGMSVNALAIALRVPATRIGDDGRFERLVIFRILERTNHRLGGQAVADGIAAGALLLVALMRT